MKRIVLITAFITSCFSALAGDENERESNFHLGIDLQTKYLWRGMEMMTNDAAPVVFPQINYQVNRLFVYVMGATAINGQYSEVDMGVNYTYKWLSIGLNDYYYPTVDTPCDQYFNLESSKTGHWFEAAMTIELETLPVYLTVSNFFAGADKDLTGKQAFSTYAELGGHFDFSDNSCLGMAVGAAFNKSCYNAYGKGFSICNIELKYTYSLALNKIDLPLSVSYIINPVFEKSFMNFTVSFAL